MHFLRWGQKCKKKNEAKSRQKQKQIMVCLAPPTEGGKRGGNKTPSGFGGMQKQQKAFLLQNRMFPDMIGFCALIKSTPR